MVVVVGVLVDWLLVLLASLGFVVGLFVGVLFCVVGVLLLVSCLCPPGARSGESTSPPCRKCCSIRALL